MVMRTASYRPNCVSFSIRRRVLAKSPNSGAKLFAAKSRQKRLPIPRPEWDSTIHDLSIHKLSAAELAGKRALHNSRHCKSTSGSKSSKNLAFGCISAEDASAQEDQIDTNVEAEDSESNASSYSVRSVPESEQDISSHIDDKKGFLQGEEDEDIQSETKEYQNQEEEAVASETNDYESNEEDVTSEATSDGSDCATVTSDSETGEQGKEDTIRGGHMHSMLVRRLNRRTIEGMGGSQQTGSAIKSNAHGSQDAAGTFPSMEKIIRASGWNSPTVDFEAEVTDFHTHCRTCTTAPPSSAAETQAETCGNKPTRKGAVRKMEGSTLGRSGEGLQNPCFKTGLVTYKSSRAWSLREGLCQRTKAGTQTSKGTKCIQPAQRQQEQLTFHLEKTTPGSFNSVEGEGMKTSHSRYKSTIQVTSPDGNQSEVVNASKNCSLRETDLQDLRQEIKQLRHRHSDLLKDFQDFRRSTEQEMKALHVVQCENQNTISSLSQRLDTTSGVQMENDSKLLAQEVISVEVPATMDSDDGCPQKHGRDESTPVRSIDQTTKPGSLEAPASQDSSQPRKIPDFLKLRSFRLVESSADRLSLPYCEDPSGVCLQESVARDADTTRTTSTLNPLFSLEEEVPAAFNIGHSNRPVSVLRHSWRDDYPQLGSWWTDAEHTVSGGDLMPDSSASESVSLSRAKFQLRGMKSQNEDGHPKSHRHSIASTVRVSFANPLYEGPTSTTHMHKGLPQQNAVGMPTSYFTRKGSTALKGRTSGGTLPTSATNRLQGPTRTFQSRLHTYSSSQKQGTGKENINDVGLMTFRGSQTWTPAKPMLRMDST